MATASTWAPPLQTAISTASRSSWRPGTSSLRSRQARRPLSTPTDTRTWPRLSRRGMPGSGLHCQPAGSGTRSGCERRLRELLPRQRGCHRADGGELGGPVRAGVPRGPVPGSRGGGGARRGARLRRWRAALHHPADSGRRSHPQLGASLAAYTTRPSNTVSQVRMSRISCGSLVRRSPSRMTTSAFAPGTRDPRRSSICSA